MYAGPAPLFHRETLVFLVPQTHEWMSQLIRVTNCCCVLDVLLMCPMWHHSLAGTGTSGRSCAVRQSGNRRRASSFSMESDRDARVRSDSHCRGGCYGVQKVHASAHAGTCGTHAATRRGVSELHSDRSVHKLYRVRLDTHPLSTDAIVVFGDIEWVWMFTSKLKRTLYFRTEW